MHTLEHHGKKNEKHKLRTNFKIHPTVGMDSTQNAENDRRNVYTLDAA